MISPDTAPALTDTTFDTAAVSPVAEKRSVRLPMGPVRVSPSNTARPPASVCRDSAPPSTGSPDSRDTVTDTPACATALPEPSRSCTTGDTPRATPLAALLGGCVAIDTWAAAPGPTDTVPLVADASPALEKTSVRSPMRPVILRSVKVASPAPLVDAVTVPPRVPPPLAMAAVIALPPSLTALPAASRSCTVGCTGKATPLVTADEGGVASVTRVATPAVSEMVPDRAAANGVLVNRRA